MDGHCKLEQYGIEIYAAIDAYSRYVIWIYVGYSGRTAISVGKQFLHVVNEHKILPKIIRSDRGGETVIMADAHWKLHREAAYGAGRQEPEFKDTYLFGTSTANQRIE